MGLLGTLDIISIQIIRIFFDLLFIKYKKHFYCWVFVLNKLTVNIKRVSNNYFCKKLNVLLKYMFKTESNVSSSLLAIKSNK